MVAKADVAVVVTLFVEIVLLFVLGVVKVVVVVEVDTVKVVAVVVVFEGPASAVVSFSDITDVPFLASC